MNTKLWLQLATAVAYTFIPTAFFTTFTAPSAAAQQVNLQIAQRFNQLPPCQLDSFVYQAGGQAEAIYGDEGIRTPPPFFGFDQSHRIDAGITRLRDRGLTTGHGSVMPSAWGSDEFIAPPGEFCRSGAKSNFYFGAQDNSYDYSPEVDAYENSLEGLQDRINSINERLEALHYALTSISQADISGRLDINQEIRALETARFRRMVRMQALQENMRQEFGER
jgi:hypothetical protein